MFPLHERTQRYLCRFAFFPLCVVPTLFVAWWCVWSNLSARVEELSKECSNALGLNVSIQELSTPQPGLARLRGVRLLDPITNDPIASCPVMTLVRDDGRWNVSLRQVEVKEPGLASFWRRLQESVETRPGRDIQSVHVEISDMTIVGDKQSLQLAQVDFWAYPHLYGRKATLEFKPAFSGEGNTIHVDCDRQDDAAGTTTRWNVLTGDSTLPAHLLTSFLPELEHLGPSCKIRGQLGWDTTGDSSEGRFSGTLSGLDLKRLSAVAKLGYIDGRGRLDVKSAVFHEGVLADINARLTAESGSVEPGLLRKIDLLLSRQIHSPQGHSSFGTSGDVVQYRQLAVAVEMGSDGWRLQGDCDDAVPGALMIDRRGEVLLRQTADQASRAIPHGDVVAMVADPKSQWIPLGEQTRWLLNHLPLLSSPSKGEAVGKDATSRSSDRVTYPR